MQEPAIVVGALILLLAIGLLRPLWLVLLVLLLRPALDLLSKMPLLPPLQERAHLPSDVLTPTGAIAILVFLVGGYYLAVGRLQAWQSRIVRAYMLLSVLAVNSLLYSIGKVTSLVGIATLGSVVAFVILVIMVLQEGRTARLFVWALFLSSLVPLTMGLYQLSQTGWDNIGKRGVMGSFTNTNTFAYFLFVLLGFGIGVFPRAQTLAARILLFSYLGLCGGLLFFTLTKGAWLAVVGCGVVYMFMMKSVKPVVAALLIALLLGIAFWNPLATRIKYGFAQQNRMEAWKHMIDVGVQKPILGHGFGTTLDIAERIEEHSYRMVPHNDFVRIFVELGVVGLAAFFYFLYSALREGYEIFRRAETRTARSMAAAFLGLFAGYIVASCVDNQLMNISLLWPMWTVFALAKASVAEGEQHV